MRKNLLTSILLSVLCLASLTAYSASDRLDFYKKDGTFISFMTDDIKKITYLPSPDGTTFSGIKISLYNAEDQILNIADFTEVKYEGISTDWLEIARMGDEHSRVIMLDCLNNDHIMSQDKPLDWTAERPNGTPHFLYDADLGFDATYSIEGQYTGTVYSDKRGFVFWSEKKDNLIGRDCWSFFMPNEPVIIKTQAKERTTYLGKDFVGTYKGYQIFAEPSQVVSSNTPSMTMELKSNESYTVKSTDNNKFNVLDLYTYDETNQTFEYQPIPREESDMGDYTIYYGVKGKVIDGFCFIDMINKIEDKPNNIRRYCLAKGDFSINYTVRDSYGSKYLLETTTTDGTKKYFFLDNYGASVNKAELNFLSGKNIITEGCKAIISFNGATRWMYKFENKTPLFVEKGQEAGTYKPESGEAQDLILDGFGNATLAGTSCTYVIDGMIATLTINGEIRLFVVDSLKNTYKEMVSDTWDGPAFYENKAVPGQYYGTTGTDNTARLTFNKNLMGKDAPGKAALQISMRNEYGSFTDIVAAVQKYIYDKAAKTITLTNILMGDASGFNGRKNITFKISDDMTKLYLDGTGEVVRIYQAADPTTYVEIDLTNALVGELPAAPITLAPKYEGEIIISNFGTPMPPQAATLTIDKDLTGAEKVGFASLVISAMGQEMFNTCVEYACNSKTVTLKGVTVGDGNYGSKNVDIVFTVEADGSLQGIGVYHGPTFYTGTYEADFNTCKLKPAAAPITLAPKYEGEIIISNFGSQMPPQPATLTINKDLTGAEKTGFASLVISPFGEEMFNTCVEYVCDGKTVTLKGVTVGDGQYNANLQTADIIFTIEADGSLQGAGKYFSPGFTTSSLVADFSTCKLKPAAAPITLAPKYEGEIIISNFGSQMPPQPATLTINKDLTGAEKTGFASLVISPFGEEMFNTCVEYVCDGKTVTLKGVAVGDGQYNANLQTADIIFTIEADGSLQGAGKYFSPGFTTSSLVADFSTCKLKPAAAQ